jgi:diketogulonate reductase-like aldo/keto reductase
MAQVALAWLRYRPVTFIPIIGARKLSQLQDNLASFNLALSVEQVKELDEASQFDPGFPCMDSKKLAELVDFGARRILGTPRVQLDLRATRFF